MRVPPLDGGVPQVHHAAPAAAFVKKISQAAACQCACEKCRCLARIGLSGHRFVLEPGWNARVNRDFLHLVRIASREACCPVRGPNLERADRGSMYLTARVPGRWP